jgi:DTW domain-containing protein YfiP
LRPQSGCICAWIRPIATAVEVVILQHPREVARAKGTARLLHLSLAHSRLVVGEAFAQAELQGLLSGSSAPGTTLTLLLYPPTPFDSTPGLLAPPVLVADVLHEPALLRLIVLDGSWRESRKLLYLNPLLQALPRLTLRAPPPSRYLIRKAQRSHQLSTLEASCAALAQLEGAAEKFLPLLAAFDGFVAQQLRYSAPGPGPALHCPAPACCRA